jgi:hypothetical protein
MERRVLVQGTMGPRLIIAQNPAQVGFTEYDHVRYGEDRETIPLWRRGEPPQRSYPFFLA